MRQPILTTVYLANVEIAKVCGGVAPTLESFVLHSLRSNDLAQRAAYENDIREDLAEMGVYELKSKQGYTTFEQRK